MQGLKKDRDLKIYSLASYTCSAYCTAQDVVIFEPPHRFDRPSMAFNKTLQEMIPLIKSPAKAPEFHRELEQLVRKHREGAS